MLISSDYRSFPVHKILLASCSDYFKQLFIDNLNNNFSSEQDQVKSEIFEGDHINQVEIDVDTSNDRSSLNQSQEDNELDSNASDRLKSSKSNKVHQSTGQCDVSSMNHKLRKKTEKIKNFFLKSRKKGDFSSTKTISLDFVLNGSDPNLNRLFIKSNTLMQANTKFQVYFPDIDSSMLSIVIHFVYTGEFGEEINQSNLFELIRTFDRLALNEILKILSQFLIRLIRIDNCICTCVCACR